MNCYEINDLLIVNDKILDLPLIKEKNTKYDKKILVLDINMEDDNKLLDFFD